MSGVWLDAELWSLPCSSPIRYGPCITTYSRYSVTAYLDMHDPPWTTSSPSFQTIFSNIQQADIWACCPGCDWRWNHHPWHVPQLSYMVHILPLLLIQFSSIPRPVWYSLDHFYGGGTVLKLDQKTRMTSEHVCGVVGGEAVTHDMFHTCQAWFIHHAMFPQPWDSIASRPAWSSLENFNAGAVFELYSLEK